MGVVSKCCCLTLVLYKVVWLALTLGPLILMYFIYTLYLKPWGEDQIATLSAGKSAASLNCSGCVLGINTQFPPNTTGFRHTLDTYGGQTMSSVVGIAIASSVASGVASMAWASFLPGAATLGSLGSNVNEVLAIVEQAQFIGLLGQLQTSGAPVFFQQFTKELAWVNFNIGKGVDAVKSSLHARRLDIFSAQTSETGVERYAATLGVKPDDLFYYTLMILAIVFAIILVLYVLVTAIMTCIKKKSKKNLWVEYFRKVIWAYVLILLLSLYIVAMTGSYKARIELANGSSAAGSGAIVLSVAIFGIAVLVGVVVIASHPSELDDLGTYEHEQRPFNAKYGAYYDEFNADNRFFFVPKAIVAVATGIVVGVVADTNWQLGLLIAANLIYLVLLVVREPFLLRFLFYIGVLSVFLKVFLLLLMIILARDDVFPQAVRDNVAYVIVAINMIVFGLLVIRQLYMTIHKMVRNCKAKKKSGSDDESDRADFNQVESPARPQHPKSSHQNDLERGQGRSQAPDIHNAAGLRPGAEAHGSMRDGPNASLQSGQNTHQLGSSMRADPSRSALSSNGHVQGGASMRSGLDEYGRPLPNQPTPPGSMRSGPQSSLPGAANGPGSLRTGPTTSLPGSNRTPQVTPPGSLRAGDVASTMPASGGNYRGPTQGGVASGPSRSGDAMIGASALTAGGAAIGAAAATTSRRREKEPVGVAAATTSRRREKEQPPKRGSLPPPWSGDAYAEPNTAVVMPEYDLDKELNLRANDNEKRHLNASFASSNDSYDRASSGYGYSGKLSFSSVSDQPFSRAMASPPPLLERDSHSVSSTSSSREASSRLDALAAKYLVEDLSREKHKKSPVNCNDNEDAKVSMVGSLKESLAFIPRPLVASKSLGLEQTATGKASDDQTTKRRTHSHNGVYRRSKDGADELKMRDRMSIDSSEDEIEL